MRSKTKAAATMENPAKRMKGSSDLDVLNNDFVIELEKYWPYGINVNEPENSDLLYVHSHDLPSTISCKFCDKTEGGGAKKKYIELEAKMRYCSAKETKEVPYADHEVEYKEFLESYSEKDQNYISCLQILRPKCCDRDKTAFVTCGERDIVFTNVFRYFYHNSRIVVYLKLDPASSALIPSELGPKFAHTIKFSYLKAFGGTTKSLTIYDTSDITSELENPEGFGLALRDYQLRSIEWMKSLEDPKFTDSNTITHNVSAWTNNPPHIKIKLGHTPYYVGYEPDEPTISTSPEIKKPLNAQRIYGGILADDTGSGKTITTLGLIHSFPFTTENEKARAERFKDLDKFHQSSASCVLCPQNIQFQWCEEALRCNPNFKIVSLAKVEDAENAKIEDVCKADLVVASYEFLTMRMTKAREFFTTNKFHFYRIIFDEFHELNPLRSEINYVLNQMAADHIWGLTGTPNFSYLPAVLRYFRLTSTLESVISGNVFAHNEFMRKFVKRNEPDLQLPPVENETVWVELKTSERVLHNWKSEHASHRTKLMLCSHYQLGGNGDGAAGEFVTIEEVKGIMVTSKMNEIKKLQDDLNLRTGILLQDEELKKTLILQSENPMMMVIDPPEGKAIKHVQPLDAKQVDQLKRQIASILLSISDVERRLNYCQSVFRALSDPEANDCSICYDKIPESSLAILPCSHLYCFECVEQFITKNQSCPYCREKMNFRSIFHIVPESRRGVLPGILATIDTSKYSSKMLSLCSYLITLLETDQSAKIILFLQYKELADFISETFTKQLQMNHVRVTGDVTQRQGAIKQFTESPEVKLIMLSSEDSVSGINLTQATHVILLHPFYTEKGEEVDLAYEKQGISRAYRFGLDHPLKIVRFAVKGTLEEEITLRRQNMKL